jgi:hypothetical protein
MLLAENDFQGERAAAGARHVQDRVPQQQHGSRSGERPELPRVLLHAWQQHERGERAGERERENVHRHPINLNLPDRP